MTVTRTPRAHIRRRWHSLLAVPMIALALSGCAPTQVAVPPNVRAALATLQALPADLYIAHGVAVNTCLDAAGYTLPFDASSAVTSGTRNVVGGVAGLFPSEKTARDNGYNSTYAEAGTTPISRFADSLPEPERIKFTTVVEGAEDSPLEKITLESGMEFSKKSTGCNAEADIAVYGSVRAGMELELFTNDVTAQAGTNRGGIDAAIRSALPAYEACMRDAGYAVTGLKADDAARERFGTYRASGAAPSEQEAQMAATDFRCQQSSTLSTSVGDSLADSISSWLAQNEKRILSLRESLAASQSRAQAIING